MTAPNSPNDPAPMTPPPEIGRGAAGPAQPAHPPAEAPLEDSASLALSEALHSSFRIVKLLMIGLVVVFLASGLFTVKPNEVAVILRFGRPAGIGSEQILRPGLHWAFPYPIDEIVRIPVGQSHTVVSTAGWYEPGVNGQPPPVYPFLRPGVDGYTLTADGNIIHARVSLKYRLDPNQALNYTFGFTNPTNLLERLLDNSLLYASARFRADEAIYLDKLAFTELVREHLIRLLAQRQMGITVDSLDVETSAPLDVRTAFDDVLNAQQTARTKISEAETYARGATNTALGQASVVYNDGLTRSNELVKTMASDARSFTELLPHYERNPRLFQQRLLAETMQRVLTNAQDKFFVPSSVDGRTRQLRIQLSREPIKPAVK